jgi:hypothetical protein
MCCGSCFQLPQQADDAPEAPSGSGRSEAGQGVSVRLMQITGVGPQAGAVEWSSEALHGVGAAELAAGAHSLHTGEERGWGSSSCWLCPRPPSTGSCNRRVAVL